MWVNFVFEWGSVGQLCLWMYWPCNNVFFRGNACWNGIPLLLHRIFCHFPSQVFCTFLVVLQSISGTGIYMAISSQAALTQCEDSEPLGWEFGNCNHDITTSWSVPTALYVCKSSLHTKFWSARVTELCLGSWCVDWESMYDCVTEAGRVLGCVTWHIDFPPTHSFFFFFFLLFLSSFNATL